jgi:TPR repeat protein
MVERRVFCFERKTRKHEMEERANDRNEVELEHVMPDATLERPHYHLLELDKLNALDDAEAIYEQGRRHRLGIGARVDEELAWTRIIRAARLGHPVALADCLRFGRGVKKNAKRCAEIYASSAARLNPVGKTLLVEKLRITQ